MTDADVRAALQLATRDVHPGADLLTGVRRGGRQRVVRRRAVLAGGLAALLACPTAGLLHRLPSRSDTPVASVLFDAATRGDLAADVGYLQLVLAEWTRHHAELSGPDSRGGEPHVVWAGSTPVGPAAVVAQRHPAADGELSGTVGFVEQTSVGPRVVSADSFTSRDASTPVPAALLGDNRDVLVVLDAGYPVSWSSAPTFRPDGRVERTFSAVAFRDGAAVLRVPAQRDRVTVALRAAFRSAVRRVDIANAAAIKARPSGQVPAMRVLERALPGAEAVWPTDPAMQAELAGWRDTALAPYRDDAGDHRPSTQPAWWIRGVTPDGRRLWVQVEASYDDPARVLAVLGRPRAQPRVIYGGMIGRREPLAVRLRLPERQGVVAQDAVLRYRTAGGSWQPVAGDAALLPDAATQVAGDPRRRRTGRGGPAVTRESGRRPGVAYDHRRRQGRNPVRIRGGPATVTGERSARRTTAGDGGKVAASAEPASQETPRRRRGRAAPCGVLRPGRGPRREVRGHAGCPGADFHRRHGPARRPG